MLQDLDKLFIEKNLDRLKRIVPRRTNIFGNVVWAESVDYEMTSVESSDQAAREQLIADNLIKLDLFLL